MATHNASAMVLYDIVLYHSCGKSDKGLILSAIVLHPAAALYATTESLGTYILPE